jgi:hypothetical protein
MPYGRRSKQQHSLPTAELPFLSKRLYSLMFNWYLCGQPLPLCTATCPLCTGGRSPQTGVAAGFFLLSPIYTNR